MLDNIILLPEDEQRLRLDKVRRHMAQAGVDAALICSNANLYYLTGRVYSGYLWLTASDCDEGNPRPDKSGWPDPVYLVKRPLHLQGEAVRYVHKPEVIVQTLADMGIAIPERVGLELGRLSYSMASRLAKALGIERPLDVTGALNAARAVKTDYEIELLRQSGIKHLNVYSHIPRLYRPGMSDIELQIEIERKARLDGCLGQFRIAGEDMELYMGNVLAGDNADMPSPYDFAMGGGGIDPSLPVGADGTIIRPGMTVMVDMNGNFTGYMTDMTRCYAIGPLSDRALEAHAVSIDICHAIAASAAPGVPAKAMYELAADLARRAGLEDYFMGHRQHAGFVGHGVGIEINEGPVLAPRSRDILAEGNVIAIEPKFVIPGTGAVGIENTYYIDDEGRMQCLTPAPQQIIYLNDI